MVELNSQSLDGVFHALADPTRRAMLHTLATGERNIGELAAPHRMSFAAASKHVKVLENAGLLRRRIAGRAHVCRIEPGPMAAADRWLSFYEHFWGDQFDTLADILEAEDLGVSDPAKAKRRTVMSADASSTVQVSRRFKASAERVFDAWLDPRMAGRWLFATPAGAMVRVEIDPRVGGQFTFVDRRDGEDVEHVGPYLEIDRPRRLVFTFAVPKYSALSTRVAIDITPAGDGCALTLTHEGILPDYAEGTQSGWEMILDGLGGVLGEGVMRQGRCLI